MNFGVEVVLIILSGGSFGHRFLCEPIYKSNFTCRPYCLVYNFHILGNLNDLNGSGMFDVVKGV